jgi:hypothetical protein
MAIQPIGFDGSSKFFTRPIFALVRSGFLNVKVSGEGGMIATGTELNAFTRFTEQRNGVLKTQ